MQKYRFKFYLNAVHSIEINGVMGQEHPHTWEIGIDALKSDNSFIMFTAIEKGVEQLLSVYQDKSMNHVPPFDALNPTLENVTIYFKKTLEQFLMDRQWFLTKLEVSETPARTFIIETKDDASEESANENEVGSWFRTVETEVEKFMVERSQRNAGDTEEELREESSFPYEEVKKLLDRERAKLKRSRMAYLSLGFLGFMGVVGLFAEKILLR